MWLDERDPVRLVRLAQERRLPAPAFLLYCASCCRLIEHLIDEPAWLRAIPQAEQFAEGLIDELSWDDLPPWHDQPPHVRRSMAYALHTLYPYTLGAVPNLLGAPYHAERVAGYVARTLASAAAGPADRCPPPGDPWHGRYQDAYREALEHQADLARCVFGPPDGRAFSRAWCSRPVCEIAAEARRTRQLSLYQYLYDALIESGCDEELVLEHCRCPRHGYGCWVVAAVQSSGPSAN